MKLIYLLPVLLLIFSCGKNNEKLENDILGEWQFEKYDYTGAQKDSLWVEMPIDDSKWGYEFKENGVYEDKIGFGWTDTLHGYESGSWYDAGRISKYEIKNDSLRLYNPVYKTWISKKIYSVTVDTLTLQLKDSIIAKYSRNHYQPDPAEKYDQIIVSASGCYGTCPVIDISISRNGDILYRGEEYTLHDGNFTSKINSAQFAEIEERFKKANIKTLADGYMASHTDDRTVTITFIKNGKIYKTISDYGNEAPAPFNWAYQPALFLYQHIKLQPSTSKVGLLPSWGARFNNRDTACTLVKSEAFYLYTELVNAKETTSAFKPIYFITYYLTGQRQRDILTDGRYYKFPPEDGGKTIDLGYNFIERNKLEKRFEKHDTN